MSKSLQIGSEIFEYPEQGTDATEGWGESGSSWAQAVTDVLGTLQNANDITLTTYNLLDNVITPTDIVGLRFSISSVLFCKIDYVIERLVGATVYVESGTILGNFDGTDFNVSIDCVGDAGIGIDCNNIGQFQYTSTNLGHTSCTIKFKANTIQY